MTNINITKEQLIEQHHEQHKQRQLQQQQQSLLSRQPPSPHRLQQKSAHEALLLSQLQSLRNGITNEQYVNNSKDGMISNCNNWPRERVNEHGYPVTTNNSIHTTTTGSSGNISTKYGEQPKQKSMQSKKKRQRRGRKPRTNSHPTEEQQSNSGESSAENNSEVATSQLDSYLRYRAISTGDRPAGTDSVSRELSNDGSSVYRDQQSFILQRQRLHQRRVHDTATRNGNDFVYHSDLYNNEQQQQNHHYGNSEACNYDGSFNSSQDYSLPRRGSTVQYSDRGSYYSNQSGTTKTSSLAESSVGDCYTTTSSNSWTKRSDLYLFISISHLITIIYLATSSSNEQDDSRSSREVANIILSSISFFISITIGIGCYYLPFQGYMTTSTSTSLPSKSQRKRSEYYEYLYSSMQSLELSSNSSSINTRFHRLRSNVTLEQMLVVLTFILTSVNCGLILYPTGDSSDVVDEGEQEVPAGNGQVWNATLFCSLWASLYGCAYNLMIVLTQSDGNESKRRDFIQRLWLMSAFSSTCAYITLFIVYSRSACDGQYLNGTLYCTSAFMGGFFNVGCSLLSFIVCVYLLRTSKR